MRNNPAGYRWGSIPACAGEPVNGTQPTAARGVYPRVCGGTIRVIVASGPLRGLSPRVRGNPLTMLVGRDKQGSIPACAGEPPKTPRARCSNRVYPRVCGGTG